MEQPMSNQNVVVKPPVQLVLAVVVVGGIFYMLGQYIASQPQRVQQETEAKREIAVQGQGEVEARPNVATVTLGVQTGPQTSAKIALDLLTQKFNAVVKAVKGLDVKDEDIKTTNLSVNPVYDYSNGRQTVRGFEASESITVKIRDLDAIGQVVAVSTAEGVNQVGGVTFEIDDPAAVEAEARAKAIADARQNAQALAKELDVNLGRVKAFSATRDTPPGPVFEKATLEAVGGDAAAPVVPAGSTTVSAQVTITYELR